MPFSNEQELLLLSPPGVVATGFDEVEGNAPETQWRWAAGSSQSLSFLCLSGRNRIYYRFTLPTASTSLKVLADARTLLTLRTDSNEKTFSGFFEFDVQENGHQTLHFTTERSAETAPHSHDPRLSFYVLQFVLVRPESPPSPEEPLPKPVHVALVSVPAWTTTVPPMGIAQLVSALRGNGFRTSVFDFNITAWHALKSVMIEGHNLWVHRNAKFFGDSALFESVVLPHLRESLDKLVDDICAAKPDVIGFSVFFTSFPSVHVIAKACKARLPGVRIICGGPEIGIANASTILDEMEKSPIDACVVGEGESTVLELLRRWTLDLSLHGCKGIIFRSSRSLTIVEPAREQLPFNQVPFPVYEDFDFHQYEEPHALPIMMSRGCVARCAFCSETRFWLKFRSRPAERTLHEITSLMERYGAKTFYFNDSLVNGNFEMLSDLVELIIHSGLKIRWMGQARVDKRMTKALLDRIAESGCYFLSYGFESGSQNVLDRMDKRTTVAIAKQVLRDTRASGIHTGLNVLVGFPGEEYEDFKQTMEFLQENLAHISLISVNEMNIFPGIPVGDDPKRFGVSTEIYHMGTEWESADGRNTPAVRHDRFLEVTALIKDHGIVQGIGSSSR